MDAFFDARHRMIRLFPIAAALALAGCATCEPKPNLSLYKEKLVAWHSSGDYAKCFAHAARPAQEILRKEIAARRPGDRIAVVFDIDETVLSNWGYLTSVGFNLNAATFEPWVRKHNDPALAPTVALFREARAANVPVFFVTGRHEPLRAATMRQLKAAGIEGWSGLYLTPENYAQTSIVPFKSGIREKLEAQGWKIVLNIGDQWSDLEGGHATHNVKLPNPYYFIR